MKSPWTDEANVVSQSHFAGSLECLNWCSSHILVGQVDLLVQVDQGYQEAPEGPQVLDTQLDGQ